VSARVCIAHALAGRMEVLRDPLTDVPIAFDALDLAAAAALVLADAGYVATRLVAAPHEPVQIVHDEAETLVLLRLLAAELRLRREAAFEAASMN
jgi:hypothetical protein